MSPMKITRIRSGWATNSSSTHSILELEPGQELPAPIHRNWRKEESHYDDFIVSDRPGRITFLHAMAADGARDACDWRNEDEVRRLYLQLAAVIPGQPLSREDMRDLRLDNLSGYAVPRKIHSKDMDVDFFERIVRLILRENVIVYDSILAGGQPWEQAYKGCFRYLLGGGYDMVSRRVSVNEWTLLDRRNGQKHSVRFDKEGRQTAESIDPPPRALEMVDVSISNACSQHCSFCYRASDPDGPVADARRLEALVKGLKGMDVMEMVLGGGEPTAWPFFYEFLERTDFGDLGVSFTTRDLNFLHIFAAAGVIGAVDVLNVIRRKVKAIGLSVRTAEDVAEAELCLSALFDQGDDHRTNNPQMVYHVIPGIGWREIFDILLEKERRMLLLGMKFTGRNANGDRRAYADTLREILKDERLDKFMGTPDRWRGRLGVDTQFIVDATAVDPEWVKRFRRESRSDMEGERSAFIDLVDGTMAPCSFGGERVKLAGYDASALFDAFERIGTYRPAPVE